MVRDCGSSERLVFPVLRTFDGRLQRESALGDLVDGDAVEHGFAAQGRALVAGFGRGIGEVGAIMIVGGNIDHVTRVLTTAIALETGRGDFALALGLGFVLIGLAIAVNLAMHALSRTEVEGRW